MASGLLMAGDLVFPLHSFDKCFWFQGMDVTTIDSTQ